LRPDPLIDLRLFRVPSYTAGVLLALACFPAMAGLPLVLALYYQQGLATRRWSLAWPSRHTQSAVRWPLRSPAGWLPASVVLW
jgi:hypothetical protein